MRSIFKYVFDALADFFTYMSNMGSDFFDLNWVQATTKLFSLFGWSLFAVGLVVAIFDVAIEHQSGRVNIKTTAINVLKGFLAVSLFTIAPVKLYQLCITLQNTFAKDLSSMFAGSTNGFYDFAGAANAALTVIGGLGAFGIFALIALGYCTIKVFFSNIKRGGILLIQIAVGSLHMFSLPRGYDEGFQNWCKQVIALCLTAFLQNTMLFLGLLTWPTNWILAIGVMIAANEIPRIAQQFGLETSARVNVMSVVHSTQSAVNLTRAVFSK